ncbi:MAG: M48 family metallopeptidase [Ekhidna sp.]|nr:M48 family metallopeptidase [Ekhidna sp.]
MKKITSLLFIGIAFITIQCSSVPLSGRSQLSLVSNDKIFPMSYDQYEEVKKESRVIEGTDQSRMVKRVGTRIQRAVEQYFQEQGQSDYLADYRWEFNLIKEDETVNAWCMPGGKVAFYTGIMPICKDETGVAVVMGHEIAHAIANHGSERMSQQYAASTGLSLASVLLTGGSGPTPSSEMILRAAGAGTSMGILAFSRKHESEADKLGLYFMAMAGYDPQEAPKFWERMAANSSGKAPPEFMSTHPSHDTRISDLNANMPKALAYYNKSK